MEVKSDDNMFEFSLEEAFQSTSLPIPPAVPEVLEKKFTEKISNNSQTQVQEFKDIRTNFQYSYSGMARDFVNDAVKYADISYSEADFIPFMSYWPTYGSMTEAQKNWYFYWRGQIRNCLYPDTDLSYIFVHIYELINNIGVRDADDSCSQLCVLWEKYRDRYPKLDRYLSDWIIDYILINNCSVNAAEAVHNVTGGHLFKCSVDIMLPFYAKGSLDKLPLEFIAQLSYYNNLSRSSFYKGLGKALMDEYIPKVLNKLDLTLRNNTGLGIFDKLKPIKGELLVRYPFKSAVYLSDDNKPITLEVLPYSNYFPLKTFLTGVLKCSENKLREINGISGRLKNFSLDDSARNIIEKYLSEEFAHKSFEPPKVKIELDESKLLQLTEASNEIRDKLLSGIEAQPESPDKVSINIDVSVRAPIITGDKAANLNKTFSSDAPAEWSEFYYGLEDYQKALLKALIYSKDTNAELSRICETTLMMPDLLIDSINETALNILGDIIIVPGSVPPALIDEHYEYIEKLFLEDML